jgi:hypothetical protein
MTKGKEEMGEAAQEDATRALDEGIGHRVTKRNLSTFPSCLMSRFDANKKMGS